MRTLLKQGADVSARAGRRHDRAALGRRARRRRAGRHAALRRRERRGGDAHRPVHAAAPREQERAACAVVQALLKAGASPAAKTTNTGVTALHLAAASGSAEVVKLLLERGADANAKEAEWGQTPLMFAAAQNRADAITALLARGADPAVTTKTIDVAYQLRDGSRPPTERQRKILEAVGAEGAAADAEPGRGRRSRRRASCIASGKIPPAEKKEPAEPERAERREQLRSGRDQPAGRRARAA